MTKKLLVDIVERTAFTGIEAAAAFGATHLSGIPTAWAVPIGMVLAAIKGYAAKWLGDPESASALPSVAAPVVIPDV